MYIEGYGTIINIEKLMASSDAGITYLLLPHLQLHYSFGTGLNHWMNYHAAGVSIRLPQN